MIMKYIIANLHLLLYKLETIWNKDCEEHRIIIITSCLGEVIYVGCTCNASFWEKELHGGYGASRLDERAGRQRLREGA